MSRWIEKASSFSLLPDETAKKILADMAEKEKTNKRLK